MPKVTLRFNLPEEKEEYEAAYNGARVASIIEELDNYLRAKTKYGELPDETHDIYQEIRDKLWELRND